MRLDLFICTAFYINNAQSPLVCDIYKVSRRDFSSPRQSLKFSRVYHNYAGSLFLLSYMFSSTLLPSFLTLCFRTILCLILWDKKAFNLNIPSCALLLQTSQWSYVKKCLFVFKNFNWFRFLFVAVINSNGEFGLNEKRFPKHLRSTGAVFLSIALRRVNC